MGVLFVCFFVCVMGRKGLWSGFFCFVVFCIFFFFFFFFCWGGCNMIVISSISCNLPN